MRHIEIFQKTIVHENQNRKYYRHVS